MLKTVSIHARHVLYVRTLLRALQAGIKSTNPLTKNPSRLLRESLFAFMRVSTVVTVDLSQYDVNLEIKSVFNF